MNHRYRRHKLLARRKYKKLHRRYHRHPYLLPVVIFVSLFFILASLFVLLRTNETVATDAKIVLLYADRESRVVPTRVRTVGEFLGRAGITLNEGDVVEPAADTEIVEDNFRVNVYRARPVAIFDGTTKTFALSAATTPRSVINQVGLNVYPEDRLVSRPTENFVRDGTIGQQVIVERAKPANLVVYGSPLTVRTHARTVGDLLHEKNVVLAADDEVVPAVDTELRADTQVLVSRKGTQIILAEEAIPMPIETIEDASLSFGTTAIRQAGTPGKRMVTYQINLVNGVEKSRTKIQEIVVAEPVRQIVARGKAVAIPTDKESIMAAAGLSAADYPYANFIISRESGWCATKWQGQIGYCPGHYAEKFPGAETAAGLGYGLCQSTPAIKMASAGADWRTNAVTQMRWCSGYARGRYGTWQAAYEFWTRNHWW